MGGTGSGGVRTSSSPAATDSCGGVVIWLISGSLQCWCLVLPADRVKEVFECVVRGRVDNIDKDGQDWRLALGDYVVEQRRILRAESIVSGEPLQAGVGREQASHLVTLVIERDKRDQVGRSEEHTSELQSLRH